MTRDVGVIIVAAGTGSRTGSSELKQFRWIGGKPMLLHSVEAFQARPDVAMVVCVLPRSHAADPPPWLLQADLDRLLVAAGGAQREDSVFAGLADLPDECRVVVVHDAARPFVDPRTIDAVIAVAREGDGALAALPVVDTIKEVAPDGGVTATVPRERLVRAQTPQAFPRDAFVRAYRECRVAGDAATDCATLFARSGERVRIVDGSERAMKITTEADFAVAEALVS